MTVVNEHFLIQIWVALDLIEIASFHLHFFNAVPSDQSPDLSLA